jgi:hypothetical protein
MAIEAEVLGGQYMAGESEGAYFEMSSSQIHSLLKSDTTSKLTIVLPSVNSERMQDMDKFHCVFREVWGVARLVAKKAREVLD